MAEYRLAGAFYVSLFRGVRRSDRLAHLGDLMCPLRRIHRSRPYHADAANTEHDECLLRHLFPALYRDDLRDSLGARVSLRDRTRLCRSGGHEVHHSWSDHPGNVLALCAVANRASFLDGRISVADGGDIQLARFHYRHLGRRLRATSNGAAADHHTADLSGWNLLLHQRPAADLADNRLFKPRRLPDQRFPLELLRNRRRQP